MRLIDEKYMECPFYGSRRMTKWLQKNGFPVNRKRIVRLMNLMGLEALGPSPKNKGQGSEHQCYAYLLKGMPLVQPNQAWATDITYIPMPRGYMYLVCILDLYSRYLLAWELSNTLQADFCITALESSLSRATPLIFNSDKGIQFTSNKFIETLNDHAIWISMTGCGKWRDNIFVERFWRSLKYEDVYLKEYRDGRDLYNGIESYINFYNKDRQHQALDYRTPEEVYFGTINDHRRTGRG